MTIALAQPTEWRSVFPGGEYKGYPFDWIYRAIVLKTCLGP
jgi:hypothetical protein